MAAVSRGDRMSGSDGEDGQCNGTIESNVVAMDDVLVKKHTDDTLCDGCVTVDGDFTRQESKRTINYTEDAVSSPIVADSIPVGDSIPVADSVPVAVCFLLANTVSYRINNRQPRTRSTCRA